MKLLDERRCRLSGRWFYSPIYLWSVEVTHYQGEVPLLYIFVWDVPAGDRGWNQPCGSYRMFQFVPPIAPTWDTSCFSHLSFRWAAMVKGGELKEQTRRHRPLTDLTSVIGVLQCQHADQIKMNGAYPGHWRLASLGPISSAPVTVHIERLIERPTMPLCEEETQTHTNRFPADRGEGELLRCCAPGRIGGSTSEGASTLMPNW